MGDSRMEQSMLLNIVDTALLPFQAATSRQARKAYIGAGLFGLVTNLLLWISAAASLLFYYNYLPSVGVEKVVHLQFGASSPWGISNLDNSLTSNQRYDVSVIVHMPRSPPNLAAGNFMIDLALLAPSSTSSPDEKATNNEVILARSRRPAILKYRSSMIERALKFTRLPLYLGEWRQESDFLDVSMFEGVEFGRGWKSVPTQAKVILESSEKIQIYGLKVKATARFRGVRYLMYNHRILSLTFFAIAFFIVSLTAAVSAYFFITLHMIGSQDTSGESTAIKAEPQASDTEPFNPLSTSDLSDTSRTFPTFGRQQPLHYSANSSTLKEESNFPAVKKEAEIESSMGMPLLGEADDEDDGEEDASFRDSGIGTSFEDSSRKLQRRRAFGKGQ